MVYVLTWVFSLFFKCFNILYRHKAKLKSVRAVMNSLQKSRHESLVSSTFHRVLLAPNFAKNHKDPQEHCSPGTLLLGHIATRGTLLLGHIAPGAHCSYTLFGHIAQVHYSGTLLLGHIAPRAHCSQAHCSWDTLLIYGCNQPSDLWDRQAKPKIIQIPRVYPQINNQGVSFHCQFTAFLRQKQIRYQSLLCLKRVTQKHVLNQATGIKTNAISSGPT